MTNLIIIVLVGLILGLACGYIYKSKKKGTKCIGCPNGCSCASNQRPDRCSDCSGCCGNCCSK